jgi:hypothetical protein
VAQGLADLRRYEATNGSLESPRGLTSLRVSVAEVRVDHVVRLMDFTKWLDRTGGSPREMSDRHRVRSILGMPVPR